MSMNMQGKNKTKISFKILSSLLSAAAVGGALVALKKYEDINLPPNPYSGRLAEIYNNASIPETLRVSLRNPLNVNARNISDVVSSVTHDDRKPVSMGQSYYNMTGRVSNGFGRDGSGFIVHNPQDPDNVYVFTSGHLVTNHYGTIDSPNEVSFTTSYISNGEIKLFSSRAEAMVVDYTGNFRGPDKTIIRLRTSELPPEIIPGIALADYNGRPIRPLEVAGYSADLAGLSLDNSCSILRIYEHSFASNCHLSQGASGGPVTIKVHDQPYIIGLNTSIEVNSKLVNHDIITSELFNEASTIREGWTKNISRFHGCREVTANVLNVRRGPSADTDIIKQLTEGDVVTVLSDQDDWVGIFTTNPKNESFYINKQYTKLVPC